MIRRTFIAVALLLALLQTSCRSQQRATVGLDVDLYLHPSSADPADVILQSAIAKRLSDSEMTRQNLVHVRVVDGTVHLSGSVRSQQLKDEVERIARQTEVIINGDRLQLKEPINNRITTTN